MPIREYTYNDRQRPHAQFPLREPKGKPTQQRWIVAWWGKDSFELREGVWNGTSVEWLDGTDGDRPYAELWSVLASFTNCKTKIWLIGHGTGYALDRANFTDSLELGSVCLPKIVRGKNRGKHGGKLTLSRRITEVDVLCGRNKIKLLDWVNFALTLPESVTVEASTTLRNCCDLLQSWLSTATRLKVQVNKTTAAQLGWSKARADCLSHALHVNLDPSCRALERRAYHAGRNECFSLGRIPGTTFSLDVKSCYANICLSENLPIRMIEEYRHGCDLDKIDADGHDHWIADVVIKTETPDYPLAWEGTPIYPVGQFRTSLPWPELRRSLRHGHVVRVLRAARYEAAPVLRDYAEWYLRSRVELAGSGDNAASGPLKAMFNASLGYTARQKYDWHPWETQIGFPYWLGIARSPLDGETPVQAQKLDDERRWLRIDGEPREAMPFIHAAITSYARIRLLEIFEAAGRENVLYCDTDGLLVTQDGAMLLEDDHSQDGGYPFGLVQRFEPGRAFIQGQKSYRVGDQIIHAGVVDTRTSALAMDADAIACGVDWDDTKEPPKNRKVRVLTCKTGRPSLDGKVSPFRFECEDTGDQNERWANVML